jgi:hypothetical protein
VPACSSFKIFFRQRRYDLSIGRQPLDSIVEFIFVFKLAKFPRIFGLSLFAATAALLPVALLSVAQSASAQTAPSLVPYTSKLIAGGGATATFTKGGTCPVAGTTVLDTYGDGCFATEIQLNSPHYAIADSGGNIYFTDYTNNLIRRVDATTGIVTAIAGGVTTSPTTGTACGANLSTDPKGDGCAGSLVNVYEPTGLAFDATGNLYFVESGNTTGNADVRKLTAIAGSVTSSSIITLVAGSPSLKVGGYATNQGTGAGTGTGVVIAGSSSSMLAYPADIAFDKAGNLYIADEGNEALEVVNLTSAVETIQGVTVPVGTIAKIAGTGVYQTKAVTGECPNGAYVSSTNRGGCYFGTYATTSATPATSALLDAPYAIGVDPAGNVYFDNEYIQGVGKIAAGSLTNYAGENGSYAFYTTAKPFPRAMANTFAIGSNFGLAVDTASNVYISDALNGVIWRVDSPTQSMYVIAGTLGTPCSTTVDTYGDGCPATQATFGKTGTSYANYGVYGLTIDAYSDLFVGDTTTNLVREIASGTQFGVVGANQPTDTVDIHFEAKDVAAATGAYTLTAGATNFSLGTATCTLNSDATTDCLLPIKATPTVLGSFTGTLQVTAGSGAVSSFPLAGIFVQSPNTSTTLSYTTGVSCTGATTYSTTTPVTLKAIVSANGPNPPVGTADNIVFSATSGTTTTVIGTLPVSNIGTSTAPIYGAVLTYTFATTGTYTLTAAYSGDTYFKPSSGKASSTITTSTPGFTMAPTTFMESTVKAGQTALYSFSVGLNVYSGTINFAVTGLPANTTYTLSPSTLVGTGCSTPTGLPDVVALSVITQQQTTVQPGGFGATGRGPWQLLSVVAGLGLALLIGLRRRRVPMRFGQLMMALALLIAASGTLACGKQVGSILQPATPTGTYTITVTATSTTGTAPAPITFPLTVN